VFLKTFRHFSQLSFDKEYLDGSFIYQYSIDDEES